MDNCSLFCTHVLGSCVIIHFFFHQLIFPKCHITYSLSGSLPQVILYSMDASPSLGAPCSVDPMLISVMCCVGCAWSLSCAQLFVTPWTIARQALQSMGILQVKNTGVGCHALLQGIFPTQGLNPGLPHCRWILYHVNHQRSPILVTKPKYCFFQLFLIRMQASREQELCSVYLFKSSTWQSASY